MKRHWNEIRCDYNNGEGFWTVDAWVNDDDNEEGKVIAVIEAAHSAIKQLFK